MTLQEKFELYHAANPHVYKLFEKYARRARNAGFVRYSANSIFEVIRWHLNIDTVGEIYKMNNNYRAFYARKFMEENPAYRGFFEIRKQRSNNA